jgi:hypothetical protein
MEQGGGSPESRIDDFLSAEARGALPIQGLKGGVAVTCHRHVLLVVDEDRIQKGSFGFFLFVLDLSVRTMSLILSAPFRKKKKASNISLGRPMCTGLMFKTTEPFFAINLI